MICIKCQKEIAQHEEICSGCGLPLNQEVLKEKAGYPRRTFWIGFIAICCWISFGVGFLLSVAAMAMIVIATGETKGLFIILSIGFVLDAVLLFWCAYGLWNLKKYGRIITLILAFFMLTSIPVGTILGILIIIYLKKPEIKALFSEERFRALTKEQVMALSYKIMELPNKAAIILISIGVFALLFISIAFFAVSLFWSVGSFQESQPVRVALVNGEPISLESYQNAYDNTMDNLRQQYGNYLTQDMIGVLQIPQQVIEGLITRRLMLQEAEKLDILVTNKELSDAIQNVDAFQEAGVFSSERYALLLEQNQITPEEFETSQREAMTIEKLYAFITEGVEVADEEILELYNSLNAYVDLNYVLFRPSDIKDLNSTEEELQIYYEANKEAYKTEPKVKVRYLAFRPDQFEDEVQVRDEDIMDYYENYISEFSEGSVEPFENVMESIREKLIKEESEDLAYDMAFEASDLAMGGEDFEKIAADMGMELRSTGFFTKQGPAISLSSPANFASAAFELSDMEVSDVIAIGESYFILQKTDSLPAGAPLLSDIKDTVRSDFIREMQSQQAKTNAENFLASLKAGDSLDKVAEDAGVNVRSTGFFKQSEAIPDIGYQTEIIEALLSMSDANKIADNVFQGSNGYYVIQLKARKLPDEADLEEQKDLIEDHLIFQKKQLLVDEWLGKVRDESEISIEPGYLY